MFSEAVGSGFMYGLQVQVQTPGLGFELWLLAAGLWLLAAGLWLLAAGFWLLAAALWLLQLVWAGLGCPAQHSQLAGLAGARVLALGFLLTTNVVERESA